MLCGRRIDPRSCHPSRSNSQRRSTADAAAYAGGEHTATNAADTRNASDASDAIHWRAAGWPAGAMQRLLRQSRRRAAPAASAQALADSQADARLKLASYELCLVCDFYFIVSPRNGRLTRDVIDFPRCKGRNYADVTLQAPVAVRDHKKSAQYTAGTCRDRSRGMLHQLVLAAPLRQQPGCPRRRLEPLFDRRAANFTNWAGHPSGGTAP